MECKYCNQLLKTPSSLKQHQKTAKYCLLKQNKEPTKEYYCSACNTGFTLKYSLQKHLQICKSNTPEIHQLSEELDLIKKDLESSLQREKILNKRLDENQQIISDQKIIIKELHADYKKQIDMQNKDFHDRMQSMAEKAIDKPSTVTKNNTTQIINNLLPITNEHLNEQVQFLTKEHVTNGAVGYAKYALEFPLKDRLVCTDSSRKKGKYKDSDGNIVSDPEMTSITRKLFLAIKDRNAALIDEHAFDLKTKLNEFNSCSDNEMDDDESNTFSSSTDQLIDYITTAYSQKRQSREMSEGLKPELFQEFVKELSSGCFVCK
jgi:hypothetical protein